MTTNQFISAFQAENPGADVNLATVAGYQVGLIVLLKTGTIPAEERIFSTVVA